MIPVSVMDRSGNSSEKQSSKSRLGSVFTVASCPMSPARVGSSFVATDSLWVGSPIGTVPAMQRNFSRSAMSGRHDWSLLLLPDKRLLEPLSPSPLSTILPTLDPDSSAERH